MDIEILKKQNNLTINDDGLIYVKPVTQYSYVTYPLQDLEGCLALTPNDYVLLKAGYYKITEDLLGLEIRDANTYNYVNEVIDNASNES